MIRLATKNDLDRIDEIAVLAIQDMADAKIPQRDLSYPRKKHYEKDVEKNALFVYELDNGIVGAMTLLPEQDPPYQTITGWRIPHGQSMVIHRVVVDPSVRNQGIAQQFLDYAVHVCKEHGYQSIKIDTHHNNYKMRRFLAKNDFRHIGYLQVINREAYEKVLEDEHENTTHRLENK